MKKKNNLKEGALDVGIQSYPTAQKTSDPKKKPTITVKKQELKTILPQVKGTDVDINVVEENMSPMASKKMKYLSDVKDANTGDISQPFDINGKKYQMVRALTPENEKVLGVYSLDEFDEENENVIHRIEEFEKLIDNQHKVSEVGVQEPEGPEAATLNPVSEVKEEKAEHPSFAGFKHFIVNKKTGKARKFKDISELAKANMSDDEQYMGVKDFKKYVDETLFGASKRQSIDEVTPTGEENDEEMNIKAKKLMDLIKKKVPEAIINTIKTPVAQREVIAAFAEMIGVPRNGLSKLIMGLKDMAQNKPTAVTESRKIVKQIKIKDIKNV